MVERSIEDEVILNWEQLPVFYCPVCGKKIVDWWGWGGEPHVEPCRHLLFIYFWNSGEFLYIRNDLAKELEQRGIKLERTSTGFEPKGDFEDILVLLREILALTSFAVFTLHAQQGPPMAEEFVASIGIEFVEESGYTWFAQSITNIINEKTIVSLRELVYSGNPPRDPGKATRKALEWVNRHIILDGCDKDSLVDIDEPLYIVNEGRGSCGDIALLLAIALLSAGIEPVYIVDYDTLNGRYVTVAVEINDKALVLDGEPIEWSKYFNNVNLLSDVRVYKITLGKEKLGKVDYCRIDKNKVLLRRCSPFCGCH